MLCMGMHTGLRELAKNFPSKGMLSEPDSCEIDIFCVDFSVFVFSPRPLRLDSLFCCNKTLLPVPP